MAPIESLRDSFVATKLNPPQWDERGVPREALLAMLHLGEKHSSVLCIVAAAGSGKSTLMSQIHRSLDAMGFANGWISLDSDDNNPAAFAAYFLSALGAIDPKFSETDFALQKDQPVHDVEGLFDDIVAYVSSIELKAAIFLDDFQNITDLKVVAFINRLIARLPHSFYLVIASRTRPPIELGRPRVSGQLTEVDQDDLNFDAPEAAKFLRKSHGLELSTNDFEALHATTEGWAAGLQLAALALRKHSGSTEEFIKRFSGRDKDLTTYLAESVLNSQPQSVRLFLLRTAPLRRMCAPLCQVVSDHPNCTEMLAHLERCKLFIIPLDRSGEWYRYHHLFAEFLQNQLRKTEPGQYQAICNKASQWCEHKGMLTEAIQYALDGGLFEKAADLIAERALYVSQIEGDHYTILDWMRRLPLEYHGRRPQIDLSHAWSCAFSRATDRATELAQQVESKLRSDNGGGWSLSEVERKKLLLFAGTIQTVAKACGDQIESCITQGSELRKLVPQDEPFLLASLCNSISYSHLAKREFESAVQIAADACVYGARANSPYASVWADFLHGLADVELGRLRSAHEHGHSAAASSGTGVLKSYSASMAALLNAEVATQRCEFDRARSFMEVGRSLAVLFGPVEPLLVAFRNDARVSAWDGNQDKVHKTLQHGRDIALKFGYPRLYFQLQLEEVNLLLLAGNVADAKEAECRLRRADEAGPLHHFEASRSLRNTLKLLDGRLLLAAGDLPDALRIITQLQYTLGSDAASTLNLTIRAVKAVALWQSDRVSESVRELDRALSVATDDLCAYPIASAGRGLIPILRAIIERRDPSVARESDGKRQLERTLLAVLSGEKPVKTENTRSIEPEEGRLDALTFREIELLRLVEAGLPNKKLADSLLITEATVKWHLHNINEKLGVGNRTAAAARARELLLI